MAVLQDEKQNTEIVRPDSRLKQRDTFRTPEELYAELEETVKKYHPSADDLSLIHRAYVVAYNAHREQKRKSGEPYIIHPCWVAIILADLERDFEEQLERLQRTQKGVTEVINTLEREDLRGILRLRYINGFKWSTIADMVGYDVRHVTRLHGVALALLPSAEELEKKMS